MVEPRSQSTRAKKIVLEHQFRESALGENTGSLITTGGYTNPTDLALAMVDHYYMGDNPSASFRSVGVAAIHSSSLLFNIKESQVDLNDEYGVASSTIRQYYEDLVELVVPETEELSMEG